MVIASLRRSPSIKISAIIPAHNTERYIATALKSIAAQTYPAHEIIVIDDASTDGTLDAIRDSGVPVKLLRGEFRNAAAARNYGFQNATGDWMALLDSDDLWYPHHLQNAVNLLRQSGDLVYMSLHDELLEDASVIALPKRWPINGPMGRLPGQDFFEWYCKTLYFAHSGVVAQMGLVRNVGGFDPKQIIRHDLDFLLRLVAGRTWSADPVAGGQYRSRRAGALSRKVAGGNYYMLLALLKNRAAFAGSTMDQMITTTARRAMATAWADGSPDDRMRALNASWPHLPTSDRLFFTGAKICPPLFAGLIRLRRKRIAAAQRA